MPEDLKKLESLDYKPICSRCQRENCECKKVLLKEHIELNSRVMGFNSAVIRQETRVNKNKTEDAGPHLQESLCRETDPIQPNLIITEIECLISQVNEKLQLLPDSGITERIIVKKHRMQALEEIDLFQKTTLCELRKAFE